MIGKTFWKTICLPSILYASSILGYTQQEIEQLQRIENKVYRHILGAPSYAQVATLRGEIGASKMETRIRANQITFLKHTEENARNDLMRRIVEQKKTLKKDYWSKSTSEFMTKIDLKYSELKSETKKNIKRKIEKWDEEQWKQEIRQKSSLKIYAEWKNSMKSEQYLYDNRPASVIFYRARTNNLSLNDRNRFKNANTKCIMCECEYEDLNHFILWCTGFLEERRKVLLLQQPYVEDEERLIGELLFEEKKREKTKETIYKFWKIREKKRKDSNPN